MGTSLIPVTRVTISDMYLTHHVLRGVPIRDGRQMEEPQYSDINDAELREIEEELGHPVTRGLAQWFIRNRINREAVERMLEATDTNRPALRDVRNIKIKKPVSTLKTIKKKKCA
jgi:hypothetical protein